MSPQIRKLQRNDAPRQLFDLWLLRVPLDMEWLQQPVWWLRVRKVELLREEQRPQLLAHVDRRYLFLILAAAALLQYAPPRCE